MKISKNSTRLKLGYPVIIQRLSLKRPGGVTKSTRMTYCSSNKSRSGISNSLLNKRTIMNFSGRRQKRETLIQMDTMIVEMMSG